MLIGLGLEHSLSWKLSATRDDDIVYLLLARLFVNNNYNISVPSSTACHCYAQLAKLSLTIISQASNVFAVDGQRQRKRYIGHVPAGLEAVWSTRRPQPTKRRP